MASELALAEKRTALAHPLEFSNEQIKILSETIAKGTTQSELEFFVNVCKMKRLDPFTGQVHCVKRWDSDLGREKMTIQVGIDGFRVIAARSGELAGITEPEFDSEDEKHPNWARVTVYRYGRSDEKIPYSAKARFTEYMQTKKDGTPNRMWATKPYIMLGKCAEALALRKAFPDELSGMYSDEEMDQADNGVTPGSIEKKPVSMPKSTDDKKLAAPAAATTQKPAAAAPPPAQTTSTPAPTPEDLSGEIVSVTPGKEGAVILNIGGKVVRVSGKLASDDLIVGAKILCSVIGATVKGQLIYVAQEIKMAVPPEDDNTIEGEIIEPGATDPVLDEARNNGLSGLFDEKPAAGAAPAATTAGEDKPGTAGMKRAKRLHTLITQNWKNVGFTEDHLKKYLATQRLEHARDLACPPKGSDAFNAYEYACQMAVGEVDYKDILED